MNELFNLEFTTGNMSQIEFFAKWIGFFSVIIISVIGFGIVQSSILKNATHGLYAVSPKFWDRVDEVKKAGLRNGDAAGKLVEGNNEISKLLGSVTAFGLSLLPNVKAMTDFDDELLDVKQYFMKAIPLMCVHIFVGVFIFFGYPAQTAQKFSEFGTGLFDIAINNIDPQAWVEALPDELAVLKYSTDGALDDESKAVNKISKKGATAFMSGIRAMNGEIDKAKSQEVALLIEQDVQDWMNKGISEYTDSNKYKMAVTATINYTGAPVLDRVNGIERDGVHTFASAWPCDKYDSGANISVSDWYLRIDLVFTPVAQKTLKSSYDCTMEVPNGSWEFKGNKGTIEVTDEITSGYGMVGGNMRGTVSVEGKDVTVQIKASGNTLTVAATGNVDLKGIKEITGVQGLFYQYNGTKQHIKSIVSGGSSVTFVVPDEGVTWKFGSGPENGSASSGDKNDD